MVIDVEYDWHDAGTLWHVECGTGRSWVSEGKRAGWMGVGRTYLRTRASDVAVVVAEPVSVPAGVDIESDHQS